MAALIRCKMCGGDLELEGEEEVATCLFCGTMQTLPKPGGDCRANLYDRANHYRRAGDFDKAEQIFDQILEDDPSDAEAYWSVVLCRYGIDYVEDPATRKRVPTVNRVQRTSILQDADYKRALECATVAQRPVYEAEAREIDRIQSEILKVSAAEEPYDVFICYKETDEAGRRTRDSIVAGELYQQLTKEGFRVFFARITLEDKLGSAYEPHIFAALDSAKVMVALGTKKEHFEAPWVKNEWSRYLKLIRAGAEKTLIPAYRDMDPYDLPEELLHLQAQDMSKLGFMQDLVHGINKITGRDRVSPEPEPEPVVYAAPAPVKTGPDVDALVKRSFMFLEDEEWEDAQDYCERALDADPECALAHLADLMARYEVSHRYKLAELEEPFEETGPFKRALRYADGGLRAELTGYANSAAASRERKARAKRQKVEEKDSGHQHHKFEVTAVPKRKVEAPAPLQFEKSDANPAKPVRDEVDSRTFEDSEEVKRINTFWRITLLFLPSCLVSLLLLFGLVSVAADAAWEPQMYLAWGMMFFPAAALTIGTYGLKATRKKGSAAKIVWVTLLLVLACFVGMLMFVGAY